MKKRLLSILLGACMALTLLPTAAFAATSYGIWVGTTQVTSDNANDVLADSGTVTYDEDTNTLTLSGANITSLCPPGTSQNGNSAGNCGGIFKNSGDIKIVLVGSNTVDISSVTDQYRPCGIYAASGNVQITSTSNGSLTIVSAPSTQFSYGRLRLLENCGRKTLCSRQWDTPSEPP